MESSVLLKGFLTVNSASGTFLTPPPVWAAALFWRPWWRSQFSRGVSITPLLIIFRLFLHLGSVNMTGKIKKMQMVVGQVIFLCMPYTPIDTENATLCTVPLIKCRKLTLKME